MFECHFRRRATKQNRLSKSLKREQLITKDYTNFRADLLYKHLDVEKRIDDLEITASEEQFTENSPELPAVRLSGLGKQPQHDFGNYQLVPHLPSLTRGPQTSWPQGQVFGAEKRYSRRPDSHVWRLGPLIENLLPETDKQDIWRRIKTNRFDFTLHHHSALDVSSSQWSLILAFNLLTHQPNPPRTARCRRGALVPVSNLNVEYFNNFCSLKQTLIQVLRQEKRAKEEEMKEEPKPVDPLYRNTGYSTWYERSYASESLVPGQLSHRSINKGNRRTSVKGSLLAGSSSYRCSDASQLVMSITNLAMPSQDQLSALNDRHRKHSSSHTLSSKSLMKVTGNYTHPPILTLGVHTGSSYEPTGRVAELMALHADESSVSTTNGRRQQTRPISQINFAEMMTYHLSSSDSSSPEDIDEPSTNSDQNINNSSKSLCTQNDSLKNLSSSSSDFISCSGNSEKSHKDLLKCISNSENIIDTHSQIHMELFSDANTSQKSEDIPMFLPENTELPNSYSRLPKIQPDLSASQLQLCHDQSVSNNNSLLIPIPNLPQESDYPQTSSEAVPAFCQTSQITPEGSVQRIDSHLNLSKSYEEPQKTKRAQERWQVLKSNVVLVKGLMQGEAMPESMASKKYKCTEFVTILPPMKE